MRQSMPVRVNPEERSMTCPCHERGQPLHDAVLHRLRPIPGPLPVPTYRRGGGRLLLALRPDVLGEA